MIPGTWQQVSIAAFLLSIALGAALAFWPARRNRRVNLPPPDPRCKRNNVESVP